MRFQPMSNTSTQFQKKSHPFPTWLKRIRYDVFGKSSPCCISNFSPIFQILQQWLNAAGYTSCKCKVRTCISDDEQWKLKLIVYINFFSPSATITINGHLATAVLGNKTCIEGSLHTLLKLLNSPPFILMEVQLVGNVETRTFLHFSQLENAKGLSIGR